MAEQVYHIPVMRDEVLEDLAVKPDGIYLDGTAGGGNHSRAIAERLTDGGKLFALDQDPDAVAEAGKRLAGLPAEVIQTNFTELGNVLAEHGTQADGILLDLGVSSHELDEGSRGFSYHQDAPLDMRMSQKGRTAADLVNTLSAAELSDILFRYGEEKYARQIAAQIVSAREQKPIETTLELAELIKKGVPAKVRRDKNPCKKSFQALRIAVNDELNCLSIALEAAFSSLKPGGRLVYSTCTFSPEENEGSVANFLELNPEFYVEEIKAPWFAPGRPEWADGNPALARCFRLWPHRLKGEGHFAAVLRKGFPVGAGVPDGPQLSETGTFGASRTPPPTNRRKETPTLPKPVAALLEELGVRLPAGKPLLFGDRVFWVPPETPALSGLKVLRPGLELAELRRELAVPAHALALWCREAASVHALSASEPACAAYLRGETLPTQCTGWTLVTADGLSLGWGKGVKGTLKNHYPKGLRISTLHF